MHDFDRFALLCCRRQTADCSTLWFWWYIDIYPQILGSSRIYIASVFSWLSSRYDWQVYGILYYKETTSRLVFLVANIKFPSIFSFPHFPPAYQIARLVLNRHPFTEKPSLVMAETRKLTTDVDFALLIPWILLLCGTNGYSSTARGYRYKWGHLQGLICLGTDGNPHGRYWHICELWAKLPMTFRYRSMIRDTRKAWTCTKFGKFQRNDMFATPVDLDLNVFSDGMGNLGKIDICTSNLSLGRSSNDHHSILRTVNLIGRVYWWWILLDIWERRAPISILI